MPAKVAAPARHPASKGFRLLSTTPTNGATGVDAGGTFTLSFSEPLALNTPMPLITPTTHGTWSRPGPSTLVFTPVADVALGTTVTMTIPGGSSGIRAQDKKQLGSSQTVAFTIDTGSTLRMQQLLAQLNYLPVSFTPAVPSTSPPGRVSSLAQPGQFEWRWRDVPPQLTALWQQGANNVISTGALMHFEDAHGFPDSNVEYLAAGLGYASPTPQVWSALLEAAATNQVDENPYTWVMVSQTLPETLTVWQNGASVFSTPANTGVRGASTANGTFPVFERFTVATMNGKNPDGSVYHYLGVPDVSYFNGGDAIHGFVRPGYGYPQSNGCVELPLLAAATVYPMTPIGTLVTVVGAGHVGRAST